ncbi:ABC transporter permease [Tabrizicola piscis]|nr:ABC transporter permease [Tabrizicola piscis]
MTGTERLRTLGLLAPAYVWLTVAVFLPLSAMAFFSLLTDVSFGDRDWSFTLANYTQALTNPTYAILLWKSLRLAFWVTVWCVILGFPCAYILARMIKGRSREALFLLVILPFWSNALVRVFSWAIVLRGNGVLDRAVNAVSPWEVKLNLMFSETAMVIGLVHSYLPYVILTTYLSLQAIDDTVIEAARSLGARFPRILWRLILPLAMPGLIAGAVLVFVPVVGSFMEPRLLGGRVGTTYGTLIEDQFVAVFNWPLGAALSFILLAVVLLILAAASPALRRAAT